jgi:hypothetical protein
MIRGELAEGRLSKLRWCAEHFETSVIMIWHVEKWCSPLLKHFMALSEAVMKN